MFVCSTTLNEIVARRAKEITSATKNRERPAFLSVVVSRRENEREERKNEIVLCKHSAFSLALSLHKRARGSAFAIVFARVHNVLRKS